MLILSRLIFFAGLLAALSGAARAQSPEPSLKPDSISPYIIEWFIDLNEDADLKQIWRLLKIEIPSDMSYRCRGGCSSETFDIATADEELGKTVALKISFEAGDFYQYLVFRRMKSDPTAAEKWVLIGYIDARGQPFGSPAHRIESGEGRTWFVVRELWGRGSGMIARGEVWYEIKGAELKRVLSYPVEGHNIPCQNSLGRSYKSFLARHGSVNGVYTVPVQLLVSYNISDCGRRDDPPSLFAKGQKAYYVWDEQQGRFVLDASQSDVTVDEISNVYNSEGLSHEEFAEYNLSELLELARGGNTRQKDWLRQFLTGIKDSPAKRALEQAIR